MIAILLTLACGGEPQTPAAGPPPKTLDLPNIILVTLDTTRADAMGSYGGVDFFPEQSTVGTLGAFPQTGRAQIKKGSRLEAEECEAQETLYGTQL